MCMNYNKAKQTSMGVANKLHKPCTQDCEVDAETDAELDDTACCGGRTLCLSYSVLFIGVTGGEVG